MDSFTNEQLLEFSKNIIPFHGLARTFADHLGVSWEEFEILCENYNNIHHPCAKFIRKYIRSYVCLQLFKIRKYPMEDFYHLLREHKVYNWIVVKAMFEYYDNQNKNLIN